MSNLTHEQLVEKTSRAMCIYLDTDPDELLFPSRPRWKVYAGLAEAAIAIIYAETAEPTEAMERARDAATIKSLQADVFDGLAVYRAMHRASPLNPEGK